MTDKNKAALDAFPTWGTVEERADWTIKYESEIIAALTDAPSGYKKPDECKDKCPDKQVCDYCQYASGEDVREAVKWATERVQNLTFHANNDTTRNEAYYRNDIHQLETLIRAAQSADFAHARGFREGALHAQSSMEKK